MHEEAAGGGFQRQASAGGTEIVLRGAVGTTAAGEVQARAPEGEHGSRFRPRLIPFNQTGEQPLKLLGVRLGRHDVVPGLLVIRRGRPSCRFEQRAKVFFRDGAVGKRARAPALHEIVMDRMIRLCILYKTHVAVPSCQVVWVRPGSHTFIHCKRWALKLQVIIAAVAGRIHTAINSRFLA